MSDFEDLASWAQGLETTTPEEDDLAQARAVLDQDAVRRAAVRSLLAMSRARRISKNVDRVDLVDAALFERVNEMKPHELLAFRKQLTDESYRIGGQMLQEDQAAATAAMGPAGPSSVINIQNNQVTRTPEALAQERQESQRAHRALAMVECLRVAASPVPQELIDAKSNK